MARHGRKQCWTEVDQTTETEYFLHYLENMSTLQAIQAYKRQTYRMLKVKPGDHILDVGCGIGDDVRALAKLVGPKGLVVGIDNSEAMITEARSRSEGLDLPLAFLLGDAYHLPFATNTFDGCRADRVFQHLASPEQALAEMIRVARPGAHILVVDPDWETVVLDAPDKVLTRRILNYLCDNIHNGWCGRQLPRLFRKAGLSDIGVVAGTTILTDYAMADRVLGLHAAVDELRGTDLSLAREITEWLKRLRENSEQGMFFCAITGFGVVGRKP